MTENNSSVTVAASELRQFAQNILQSHGTDPHQAEVVADILVWCNEIGRSNQGVWRLPIFCKRLSLGLVSAPCVPRLEKKSESLALLDGDNGLGHYVGQVGMDHAIDMAAAQGVGVVTVCNSNFYGAGSYYVERAAQKGMLALALSNSFPKVVPYNGLEAVLGTNPFSFGAPLRNKKSVLFDMATAASAGSMIRRCQETGADLPEGIAIHPDGRPITNPSEVDAGALLPAGGAKGFGLAILVEVLCGVISGAGISHQVTSMYKNFDAPGNNGHFFLAIDVKHLMSMDQYFDRMDMLVTYLKNSPSLEGEVLYPGELRWNNKATAEQQGIRIESETIVALEMLAKEKNISLPW